jgi:hypothetical protein
VSGFLIQLFNCAAVNPQAPLASWGELSAWQRENPDEHEHIEPSRGHVGRAQANRFDRYG